MFRKLFAVIQRTALRCQARTHIFWDVPEEEYDLSGGEGCPGGQRPRSLRIRPDRRSRLKLARQTDDDRLIYVSVA